MRGVKRRRTVYNPGPGQHQKGEGIRNTGYVDFPTGGGLEVFPLNTTGKIKHVNVVPQGSSQSQRIGKKIALKGFQIRGFATNNATSIGSLCSVIFVYDKRPTLVLPAITDVLVAANSTSLNNRVNSDRFSIMRRWDWYMNGSATDGETTANTGAAFCQYIKVPKKYRKCVFQAVGDGAIGDVAIGAVYMISVGNLADGADADLSVRVRCEYNDIVG